MPSSTELTVLLTGATDGHGRAVAANLAERGATVLLHGRDADRGRHLVDELTAKTGNERLSWYQADLASLSEVRTLADAVSRDHERLDVLVNNAGIGATVPGGGLRQVSADGHELRFAVNYLAGYALTRLLWPRLAAAGPGRIVNVSSAGQMPVDFADPMLTGDYNGGRAYCQSKLAQILMTFDQAGHYPDSGVAVTCLHPSTYMPTKIVASPLSPLEQGADATVRLIAGTEPDEVNGRYFDVTRPARADEQAYDADARTRLRELSDRLTGLAAA